jgi:hypothetical protein
MVVFFLDSINSLTIFYRIAAKFEGISPVLA